MQRKIIEILNGRLAEKYPLIQVVLGPRQVGKTTAAQATYDAFPGAKFIASADSPTPLSSDWLEARWLQARAAPKPTLLILDEIQKVFGWSEVVKKLFDEDRNKIDLRVLLLGSASLTLQSGIKESLAGRFELIPVEHWNFAECSEAFGWDLELFLKYGGYPGAARYITDKVRWQSYLKNSIIEPVLGRDISAAISIAKPALFRQVFEIAMHYPAQELSYQKIVGQLQERGSVQTVKHYLEILEGAFLLRQIFRYSSRPLTTRTSSPKIVIPAPALIHAFADPGRVDLDPDWRGRVFESVIGATLCSATNKVFTWREKSEEVDYIIESNPDLFAVEVKSGRRVQSSGLDAFIRNFPHAKPIVVTPNNCAALLSGGDLIKTLIEWKD